MKPVASDLNETSHSWCFLRPPPLSSLPSTHIRREITSNQLRRTRRPRTMTGRHC